MGQKTNPISLRLGYIKGWDSNWFGGKNYADKILEDDKIRRYLSARINNSGISKLVIERTLKRIIITIHTSRPGIVIGKGGQEVDRIKEEIKKLTQKEIQINIHEIKKPELEAALVAEGIARQLEGRVSFRRAMKMALASTMRLNAEGIKVMVSVVWAVQKLHEPNNTKKAAFPCTPFVLTLITLSKKPKPFTERLGLKFGFVGVKFSESAICLRM